MDKQKATELLVKELVKAEGQTFVTDTAYKKHLLEKAVAYYPIESEKPFSFKFRMYFLDDKTAKISYERLDKAIARYKEKLVENGSEIKNANYIFLENSQSYSMADNSGYTYTCLSLMDKFSFFALIGDKEVNDITRMFYKDVDNNIIRAMDALKIKNFVNLYKRYKEKDPYFTHYYRPTEKPDSFLEFVFAIPYEDQNIQTNQNILRSHYYSIDFIEILIREYSGGKFFQEYFNCLDSDNKGKVFDNLRNVKERNPINDSFLWSAGFKELRLDHIEIYKNSTSNFIEYFNNRSLEEKKMILKDLMNYDSTNEEVIKWLNENYLDLIREVGFNG